MDRLAVLFVQYTQNHTWGEALALPLSWEIKEASGPIHILGADPY